MVRGVSKTEVTVGGKVISFETGRLAKQASGSVLIRTGDTMVLVTAVVATNERNVDFFPLTVDVEAGMYAAGKIPGGFIKKEAGRATTRSSRAPHRPAHPASVAEGLQQRDAHRGDRALRGQEESYDVLAVTGASALSASPTRRSAARSGSACGQGRGRVDHQPHL